MFEFKLKRRQHAESTPPLVVSWWLLSHWGQEPSQPASQSARRRRRLPGWRGKSLQPASQPAGPQRMPDSTIRGAPEYISLQAPKYLLVLARKTTAATKNPVTSVTRWYAFLFFLVWEEDRCLDYNHFPLWSLKRNVRLLTMSIETWKLTGYKSFDMTSADFLKYNRKNQ